MHNIFLKLDYYFVIEFVFFERVMNTFAREHYCHHRNKIEQFSNKFVLSDFVISSVSEYFDQSDDDNECVKSFEQWIFRILSTSKHIKTSKWRFDLNKLISQTKRSLRKKFSQYFRCVLLDEFNDHS